MHRPSRQHASHHHLLSLQPMNPSYPKSSYSHSDITRLDGQRSRVDDDVALNRNAVVLAGIAAIFVDNAATIRFQVILIESEIRRSPASTIFLIFTVSFRLHRQSIGRNPIAIHQRRIRKLLECLIRRTIRLNHFIRDLDGLWPQCHSSLFCQEKHHNCPGSF